VAEPEPIAWDPERYTVDIVEPDWYAEEEPPRAEPPADAPAAWQDDAPNLEPETERMAASGSAIEDPPTPEAEPAEDEGAGTSAAEAESEPGAESEEETMLWFGRTPPTRSQDVQDAGADEIEIVGANPRSARAPLPGSQELDEALAALDALAPPDAAAEAPPASQANETETSRSEASGSLTSLTRPSTTATTRAYRRLRRIFPG
jgi:hypothetical protein